MVANEANDEAKGYIMYRYHMMRSLWVRGSNESTLVRLKRRTLAGRMPDDK